jgi:hypothetical protein
MHAAGRLFGADWRCCVLSSLSTRNNRTLPEFPQKAVAKPVIYQRLPLFSGTSPSYCAKMASSRRRTITFCGGALNIIGNGWDGTNFQLSDRAVSDNGMPEGRGIWKTWGHATAGFEGIHAGTGLVSWRRCGRWAPYKARWHFLLERLFPVRRYGFGVKLRHSSRSTNGARSQAGATYSNSPWAVACISVVRLFSHLPSCV